MHALCDRVIDTQHLNLTIFQVYCSVCTLWFIVEISLHDISQLLNWQYGSSGENFPKPLISGTCSFGILYIIHPFFIIFNIPNGIFKEIYPVHKHSGYLVYCLMKRCSDYRPVYSSCERSNPMNIHYTDKHIP